MNRRFLLATALFALAACSPTPVAQAPAAEAAAPTPVTTEAPAGAYVNDPAHTSLILRFNHISFSNMAMRFTDVRVDLQLDPTNPTASALVATVKAASITSDNAPEGFLDLVRNPQWLDAAQFPDITYRSTAIELTGPDTALIRGDLTLHGVTKPLTLEAKFNGGYAGHPYDPNARVGFSATGSLKRTDFGIAAGLPPAGSTMGVGDEVTFAIESELTGPPLANPPPPPTDATH